MRKAKAFQYDYRKWGFMMAAPVGHLYLAIQILSGPLCEVKERDFLIGTLFPDIRYPAQIARELTHKSHVTWQEIINEKDPFMQGIVESGN